MVRREIYNLIREEKKVIEYYKITYFFLSFFFFSFNFTYSHLAVERRKNTYFSN